MAGLMKTIYRGILRKLPMKPALYLIFFRGYRRILNLKNPRYYGEKIQWLKLYGNLEELADYVDKYTVREFVEKTIGAQYLNAFYGVYDSPEEIDYDVLPEQFVLKCTNGSGAVMIVKDKSELDRAKAQKVMEGWLKNEFYKMKKELQYKPIRNRIIAEGYLEDETGALRDYKFWCFDGEPACYGVFSDRFTDETIDFYDMAGNKLDVTNSGIKGSSLVLPQPDNFDELVDIVKKLARPFRFVRVDFYLVNGRPIFGELTFTDGAGSDPFAPLSYDLEMAEKIKLEPILRRDLE